MISTGGGCAMGPPQDECDKLCENWREGNEPPIVGMTICDSNGNKCACTGSDEQIKKRMKDLGFTDPFAEKYAEVLDSGTPLSDSFVSAYKHCVQVHEDHHAQSAIGECPKPGERGYPESIGKPAQADVEDYYEDEWQATAKGLDCIAAIDCAGDSDCAEWKEAMEDRAWCKLWWLKDEPPPEGCVW